MKILITGASGFIGSFIVEEALNRGFETWAGVRTSSSRKYLQDNRIHFLDLDFSSENRLVEALRNHEFDYIVHAAGATKCLHKEDFYRINYEGTKNFVHRPYLEIDENETPRPNTAYGKSKLKSEQFLDSIGNDFNYVILRPTGVYGPREKDYFLMAKSIKQHIDFSVGYKQQDITFVYVKDVVQAVFLSLDHGMSGRKYFLSDGNVYQSKTFSDYLYNELGLHWWIRIKAPIWLLRIVTFFGEYIGRMTGHMTTLNNDKFNILKQRNWRCNIEAACDELGYHPHYGLRQGVSEAVAWYKANGWL